MTCMSDWSTIQLNPLVLTHLKCRSRFIRDLDGENYSRTLTWTMSDCEAPKKELMDSVKMHLQTKGNVSPRFMPHVLKNSASMQTSFIPKPYHLRVQMHTRDGSLIIQATCMSYGA